METDKHYGFVHVKFFCSGAKTKSITVFFIINVNNIASDLDMVESFHSLYWTQISTVPESPHLPPHTHTHRD